MYVQVHPEITVYDGKFLKDFQILQEEFGLPTKGFFQDLQLCHAIQTQSRMTLWVYIILTILNQSIVATSK